MMLALLLACRGVSEPPPEVPAPEAPSDPTTTPAEAAEIVIEALVTTMCEADQRCSEPAFGSARECECAGLAEPFTQGIEPAVAQACVDALATATLDACEAFHLSSLPTACVDLMTGPEAPAEVVVLSINGRFATTERDCGEEPFLPCDGRRVLDDGCLVDPSAYERCQADSWACVQLPASCFDAVVCPGEEDPAR